MRVINNSSNDPASSDWSWNAEGVVSHRSYHELSDRPVVEMNDVAQLQANMDLLKDLQGRLTFLMREVRYIMKV